MGAYPFICANEEENRAGMTCSVRERRYMKKVCRKLVHRGVLCQSNCSGNTFSVVGRYTSNSTVSPGFSLYYILHSGFGTYIVSVNFSNDVAFCNPASDTLLFNFTILYPCVKP